VLTASTRAAPIESEAALSHVQQHHQEVNEMEIITLFGEGNSSKTYELTLKHPTPRTDEWACVGEDPELFHPEDLTQLAEAQQVCADCPMRQTCLELGTARREWGVWGGVLLESGKPRDTPRTPGRKPYKRSQEAIARARRVA